MFFSNSLTWALFEKLVKDSSHVRMYGFDSIYIPALIPVAWTHSRYLALLCLYEISFPDSRHSPDWQTDLDTENKQLPGYNWFLTAALL